MLETELDVLQQRTAQHREGCVGTRLRKRFADLGETLPGKRDQDLVFVGEVVVQRHGRVLDLCGDLTNRQLFIPAFADQFPGRIKDVLPKKFLVSRLPFTYTHRCVPPFAFTVSRRSVEPGSFRSMRRLSISVRFPHIVVSSALGAGSASVVSIENATWRDHPLHVAGTTATRVTTRAALMQVQERDQEQPSLWKGHTTR